MDQLVRGAIATGIAAAAGVITSLPSFDPDHFSASTGKGLLHLIEITAWIIFVAEVRYAKAWADKILGNGNGEKPK